MTLDTVIQGDCLDVLSLMDGNIADLVYLDPPFFTRRDQIQTTRDGAKTFRFSDTWASQNSYLLFLRERMQEIHRVLKPSGSVFFHCDRNSTHLARIVLEEIFGAENFRSEIIWHYRRWANSQDTLLPAHQTILFFTKTDRYKFNRVWGAYSPSTNLDQIWQRRTRDHRNKTVYARDEEGNVLSNGEKQGVPLGDVWDIPYLNPKAKERTGYPTQKPLLLLERIVALVTDTGDCVFDPFCGSGTTLVAAKLLNRHFLGIDVSDDATSLTRQRLASPLRSLSGVFENGRETYEKHDEFVESALAGIDVLPVQRNGGIDAFLKNGNGHGMIPLRVQRPHESLADTVDAVHSAASKKGCSPIIVIQTHEEATLGIDYGIPEDVLIVSASNHAIHKMIAEWQDLQTQPTALAVRETHRRTAQR
jgi:site-specific DNA-methyltransferase (adenine-specific)